MSITYKEHDYDDMVSDLTEALGMLAPDPKDGPCIEDAIYFIKRAINRLEYDGYDNEDN